jgi:hypothetical protein
MFIYGFDRKLGRVVNVETQCFASHASDIIYIQFNTAKYHTQAIKNSCSGMRNHRYGKPLPL